MALQAEGAGGGGRRRLWSTLLPCFGGSRTHDKETAARARRRKRTVPVDVAGDEAVSPANPADLEMRRGEGPRRRRGCCFLPPLSSCVPGFKRNVKGSDRQRQQELVTAAVAPAPSLSRPPNAKAPPPPRHDVAPATTRGGGGGVAETPMATREAKATAPRAAGADASDGVAREFGPAVGVCVVAAVSMAGLIGGRVWAVVCVCAWFAALYGLRLKRRRGKSPAAARGLSAR